MSASENGNGSTEQRQVVSPGRVLGARSASPAKRSAADMEAGDKSGPEGQHVPGSFTNEQESGPSQFDEVYNSLNPSNDAMDTQETATNSANTSIQGSMTTNTSATSFDTEAPPPYSATEGVNGSQKKGDVPSFDEQYKKVAELVQGHPADEGEAVYLVSGKWLSRVLSRTTDGLKDSTYAKEAREGPVGAIDNSDIVPEGAFAEPILKDAQGQPFIPTKPGLGSDQDFQFLTRDAYGLVVSWYGNTLHQKPIIRYAHNTAPEEASQQNYMYELYPPVITVRKVPQKKEEADQLPAPRNSLDKLRLKDERRGRGQLSPDDAIQLVSSRSERFNDFLKRAKDAAEIPRDRKVKIWKLLDPSKVSVDAPDNRQTGVLSPPESRSASPKAAQAHESKLVIDLTMWASMEIGADIEPIDAKDETNNSSYNGRSIMEIYQLYQDTTIALEEQITDSMFADFPSDSKKLNPKSSLTRKILGSKPGSASASGRTSPAPGGGMMTRGRARRDGRTRGTIGLTNLGNTCYMNSALQCIRSVEELAIYFLSGKFKEEINTSNPLGHNGAMAKRYYELLQSIYSDQASGAITPTAFRKTLGSIQPMFSGYGQQDSQEFLSFLVDALHEDLNRIIKKPYNENPDSDDNTVHDPQAIIKLGETYRDNHKARNDSIAMDLFSGFYKNTMECPKCDKISITFDPYSLLTVQLPIENTFQHTVTFVPSCEKPVNHMIDMDKNSTIKMLKESIASKHAGVQADRLWMVEVYNHKIYKVFDDATTLGEASIQNNDYLFVFELDAVPTNLPSAAEKKSSYSSYSLNNNEKVPEMEDPKADQFAVPIFSRKKTRFGNNWDIVMHPIYVLLTREEAKNYEVILRKVLIAVSRLTSRPLLAESDETSEYKSTTNGQMKDDSPTEDNAQTSDRSAPSEEGYVEVSLGKSRLKNFPQRRTNGVVEYEDNNDDRPIPKKFTDPQHFLDPVLRSQLFTLNYAQSESGGLHCAGMASIKDTSVRNMFDRVKLPSRKSSVQSSSSGEDSTTSTGSGAQVNGDADESDEDSALGKPDLVLGGEESSLGLPSSLVATDSDGDQVLNPNPLAGLHRGGRLTRKELGKKGRGMKKYGKKGNRGNQHNQQNNSGSFQSQKALGNKSSGQDDNPYYIKLGEGIVLDWYPDSHDDLFAGGNDDQGAERGKYVSSDDGKGLPFFEDPELEARKSRREARKKNGITLDDCFVETGKREVLSEDNAWFCNRCKELRRATKTLEIWTIPDILVVHLKRFGGNRSFRDKIDVLVDYPIEGLDMTDRIGLKEDGKEYVYDLFAVDNHFGGLGGGHYTAFAKNFYDGLWYDYNDGSCSKVSENRLHSAAAYLLFYRRRSDKPLGPQYLQDLVFEARNPQQVESAAEEPADEAESGEGRLGGPNGSLHGSSSALIGAGAGLANLLGGGGGTGAGAGAQASSSLTTKTSQDDSSIGVINGEPVYGPQRPPHLLRYGEQGNPWSFANIDETPEADDAAERLISNVDDNEDDDAASTTALLDNDEIDLSDRMDEDFNDFGDNAMSAWSTAAPNTPAGNDGMGWPSYYHDDHQMYSAAHEEQDAQFEELHLDDAGAIGDDIIDDPPLAVIDPSLLSSMDHEKTD